MKTKILIAVVATLASALIGWHLSQSHDEDFKKYRCSDFTVRTIIEDVDPYDLNYDGFVDHLDAQKAKDGGATYLDGDSDGIACENLLPNHAR